MGLAILIAVGCVGPKDSGGMVESDIVAKARIGLRQNHPQWAGEFDGPLVVTEKQDYWGVRSQLPPDTLGGGPVVVVEKATGRIARTCHEQ